MLVLLEAIYASWCSGWGRG